MMETTKKGVNKIHSTPPSPPPRLILGSSLIKLMAGIKATRIKAIPGAEFCHLNKWAYSIEGRDVLRSCKFIIVLCGGNSISNGMPPHIVFTEAKRSIDILKSLSLPLCQIFLSTLPPRPQIDSQSNGRIIFNELVRHSQEDTFSATDGEMGLLNALDKSPKYNMLNQAERRRGIVHLSNEGIEQLRRNYARTFGKANRGCLVPAYIIKKNEIGFKNSYHISN